MKDQIEKFRETKDSKGIIKAIKLSKSYILQLMVKKTRRSIKGRIKHISRNELKKQADKIYEFSEGEDVEIRPLSNKINLDEFKKVYGIDRTNYSFQRPFVAEIHSGRILSQSGETTTKNYEIVLDAHKSSEKDSKKRLKSRILYKQNKPTRTSKGYDYDVAVPMTGVKGLTGYWIWLHTYLTKLEGLKAYEKSTGTRPKIIIPQDAPKWVEESLEFFGYGDDIETWNPKNELKVKKLVVPSNRRIEGLSYEDAGNTYDQHLLAPEACSFLKKEALRHNSKTREYSNKVFISREDASKRKLKNKENIRSYLEKKGFKSYKLSELSFSEQISLFSQAEVVLGVHGAGLTNLIFSSNCKVYEIFGDFFKPKYYLQSQSQGLYYTPIYGKSIPNSDRRLLNQDILVSQEELEKKIDSNSDPQ
jgi:hypothetical protein